jgi:hypothetical protein
MLVSLTSFEGLSLYTIRLVCLESSVSLVYLLDLFPGFITGLRYFTTLYYPVESITLYANYCTCIP